jgi:hypothetical protein
MKNILIVFMLLISVNLLAQIEQDSTIYKLTETKLIDGIEPCNYVKIEYPLDSSNVVGSYGLIDGTFVPLYNSAVIPKNTLIDYEELEQ